MDTNKNIPTTIILVDKIKMLGFFSLIKAIGTTNYLPDWSQTHL